VFHRHRCIDESFLTLSPSLICSVIMLLSDMSGRTPLYRKYVKDIYFSYFCLHERFVWVLNLFPLYLWRAFVFFSSPISRELVNLIKKDTTVLPRIVALKEVVVLLSWKIQILGVIFVLEHFYMSTSCFIFFFYIVGLKTYQWIVI
jgi:hypothetical protein